MTLIIRQKLQQNIIKTLSLDQLFTIFYRIAIFLLFIVFVVFILKNYIIDSIIKKD
jgi:hypothetical protein